MFYEGIEWHGRLPSTATSRIRKSGIVKYNSAYIHNHVTPATYGRSVPSVSFC
jgi:hypothetical protein